MSKRAKKSASKLKKKDDYGFSAPASKAAPKKTAPVKPAKGPQINGSTGKKTKSLQQEETEYRKSILRSRGYFLAPDEEDQAPSCNDYAVNHKAQNFKKKQLEQKEGGFNTFHAFNYGIAKAGMQGVDPEYINQKMKEAVTNQQFYQNQENKIKNQEEKIKEYKAKIQQAKSNPKIWEAKQLEVKRRLEVYAQDKDLTRTWMHVDMDMFYAAVEIRDNPDLKDLPVAVGDYQMIMTTNYVARKYGVRSAMPGFMGKRLCPQLKFVKPDKEKYKRVSDQEFKPILREYDDKLESVGSDEANLDVTDYLQANGLDNPEGRMFLASKIRQTIKTKMKMTSSIGIACNKMLAKMCSELDKPDGQTYLSFDDDKIKEFMLPKEVRNVPGIGKVQEQTLIGLGIKTCQQIIDHAIDIYLNFTEKQFEFLVKAAMGISRSRHEHDNPDDLLKKSVSFSKSFKTITTKDEKFKKHINNLSAQLADKLTEMNLVGRTLAIEVKNEQFQLRQKSITFNLYISHRDDIAKYAQVLLDSFSTVESSRMLMLKVQNLRYRTDKDPKEALTAGGKNISYTSGKGRRKVIDVDHKPQQSEYFKGLQSSSATMYHEKKRVEENRYKKLIGQKDISSFFKPKQKELETTNTTEDSPLVELNDQQVVEEEEYDNPYEEEYEDINEDNNQYEEESEENPEDEQN